jgi:hypothetical protein
MKRGLAIAGAILVIATSALLLVSLSYSMPAKPPVSVVALDKGLGEVLWGYRAIDMLTQILLILGAACGVTALFRLEPPKEVAEEEEAVVEAPLEEAVEEEV